MTLLRSVVVLILYLCVTNSALGQNQSVFEDCPQAEIASSYELWGIQLIEDCNATPVQLEALRPVLDSLLASEDDALFQSKLDTLRALRERVLSLNARSPQVSTQSVDAFALALSCDINQLENSRVPQLENPTIAQCELYGGEGRALQVQKWQTLDASGSAYKEIFLDVFETLSPGCLIETPDSSSACHTTMTDQLIPVLELYNVMSRMVLPALNRDAQEGVVDRYSNNHLRWKNYVLETGFQYPWELLFNKRQNGGFKEIITGRSAPEQRWVLLHPTAGLYHSEKLEDGSQTDLLGVLKIIGKKYWKYAPDNQPRGIIGLSLTSTFADIQGIEDVGYGLMAEYNGFGLGISRHGNQQLIIFNVELNNFLLSRPKSFRQWLSVGTM